MSPTPRTFSHIGLSVPDLEAAVRFYSEVMGFYVLRQPSEVVEDDSAIGRMCTDVFGPGWTRLRIAHLSTADGIGFEAGGRQRMPVREYFPGEKPYRMVYVEDPFGIVFELYSHSYELTYSAGAY